MEKAELAQIGMPQGGAPCPFVGYVRVPAVLTGRAYIWYNNN